MSWSKTLITIAALALACSRMQALPSDRGAPISIDADTAVQEKTQALYQGDVLIVQGTLRIEADEVQVYTDAGRVSRIVALGRPARMQQQPRPEDELVRASAMSIDYEIGSDTILLSRSANVVQGGSEISGERIEYVIDEQVVKADAGDGADGGRVRMILQPDAVDR